ncbi:hypothetical protein HYW30_00295 [Candidatus Azambacteria bacterium]|nr:hypothetical protein [Candidatus Azambacteria bacterium]MBI2587731.1 hypothetical protein [Candidatus Azambacteria bacterium]
MRPSFAVALVAGLFVFVSGPVLAAETDQLEAQLRDLSSQISAYENAIRENQKQERTLKREIEVIDARLRKIDLEIQATDIEAKLVEGEIAGKVAKIQEIEGRVANERVALAGAVREVSRGDAASLLELVLTQKKFSDFFDTIQAIETVQRAVLSSLREIHAQKIMLSKEKEELEARREELLALKILEENERGEIENIKAEKQEILAATKGRETAFGQYLKNARLQLADVRQQLFEIKGIGLSIPFPEAYGYARFAAEKTGVRTALILAVLKAESNFGVHVGSGSWRTDMHPRDQAAYLDITKRLGLSPDVMPVSRKPSYGWGGAMGPAQILPATWLGLEEEVSRITGSNPPSPWNLQDAFVAAAVKLRRAGANRKTAAAEWRAAMIYFAGSNWTRPAFSFYGNTVTQLAKEFDEKIAALG